MRAEGPSTPGTLRPGGGWQSVVARLLSRPCLCPVFAFGRTCCCVKWPAHGHKKTTAWIDWRLPSAGQRVGCKRVVRLLFVVCCAALRSDRKRRFNWLVEAVDCCCGAAAPLPACISWHGLGAAPITWKPEPVCEGLDVRASMLLDAGWPGACSVRSRLRKRSLLCCCRAHELDCPSSPPPSHLVACWRLRLLSTACRPACGGHIASFWHVWWLHRERPVLHPCSCLFLP